jgi:hypothetical protein
MLNLFKKFFKKKRNDLKDNKDKTDPKSKVKMISEPEEYKNKDDISIVNNQERGKQELDEKLVEFYEENPIFKDFLTYNDASLSFLESTKDSLKQKQFTELTDEERCYYLSNKASYYQCVVRSKLEENRKLDKLIEKKKQNIKRLAYEIDQKKKNTLENDDKLNLEKVGTEYIYQIDKNVNIESIKQQTSQLESKLELLNKRIEDINTMLSNFDNPIDTLPIGEILKGLKEEKRRIKDLIDTKHNSIKDFEEKINYYRESLQVLEMKYK